VLSSLLLLSAAFNPLFDTSKFKRHVDERSDQTTNPVLVLNTKAAGSAYSVFYFSGTASQISSCTAANWIYASAVLSGYTIGGIEYTECRSDGVYFAPPSYVTTPSNDPNYATTTVKWSSGRSTACAEGLVTTCGSGTTYSFKTAIAIATYTVGKCPSKDIWGAATYFNTGVCQSAGAFDYTTDCKGVTTCYSSTDGSCTGSYTCPTTTTTTSATPCYNQADVNKVQTNYKGGCLTATSTSGNCALEFPSTYYAPCGHGVPGKAPNGNSGAQIAANLFVVFGVFFALF